MRIPKLAKRQAIDCRLKISSKTCFLSLPVIAFLGHQLGTVQDLSLSHVLEVFAMEPTHQKAELSDNSTHPQAPRSSLS